ncbi:MAG: aryl-sulfate sulfotransferase [Candidatus Thermoplasmatota archaeon]|nr:aryl-sulfate sulfotransferase [Candidatus Thermoplasmatota archaeon]
MSGHILFSPMYSTQTYLIERNGDINHTWSSDYFPGESVYMLENNTILRSIKITLTGGGSGGGVQKIAADNTLLWDFRFYSDTYLSTHDIEPLPNGNVLILAWELKTRTEAIAAGRDPTTVQDALKPNFIAEIQPTGLTTGDVVWEWHAWDHLIQEYDPGQDNYGVVADHPELININFGFDFSGTDPSDWLHSNSIDYNPGLDQIMLSVRYFNELWVIDHSTTTAEAASHTGGNSGKGGDLLYRWGNPQAYQAGTEQDRQFFQQHDATWIDEGYPGGGHIMVFNNGVGRPGGGTTTVDEIIPPVNSTGHYYLETGSAYGPETPVWVYHTGFFAKYIGGALRLHTGNTLVCNGPAGHFLEVTPEFAVLWEYTNPYPNIFLNHVFKLDYIASHDPSSEIPDLDAEGSLSWTDVPPGGTVNGSFAIQNVGGSESFLDWEIASSPTWGTWSFHPDSGEHLNPEDGSITVNVTVRAPERRNREFTGLITIVNVENPDDYDVIPIQLHTPSSTVQSTPVMHRMRHYVSTFPIVKILSTFLE